MVRGSLPSRSLSIALLALLALSLLPTPVSAQIGGGSLPPQDTTLMPDAQGALQVVTDPAGDQTLLFGVAPGDGTGFDETADILGVTISENEHGLLVALKHRGYPDTASTTTSEVVLGQELRCDVNFQVEGDEILHYNVDIFGENLLDGGPYRFNARINQLRIEESENSRSVRYDFGPDLAVALVADDHIEAWLPKEYVENEKGQALKVGSRLVNWEVYCQRSASLFVQYQDEAGGEAGSTPYTIRAASRSAQLAIAFPEAFKDGALAVDAGAPTKLSVQVSNLASRKLLVNVTASIVDAEGKALPGWKVQTAPTFEVPFNATLPASIIVTPPADATHRTGGLLKVKATPIGFANHVQLTKFAYAVVSPSVDQNILFFHDAAFETFWCFLVCSDTGLPAEPVNGPTYFFMNVLDDDAGLTEEDTDDAGIAMISSDYTAAFLDTPLSHPLRFNPDGVYELTTSLRSDVAREVTVDLSLLSDDATLGYLRKTITLKETFDTFTFAFPTNLEALAVPAGNRLRLDIDFREASNIGFSLTGGTYIAPIDWRPSDSKLVLPLVSVPKQVLNVTDGRSLPTLALSNNTDAEEYLNPGQTQAFDMFLVNEGLAKDVVGLKADFDKPGWTVGFFPGNQFELEPGTSAPLCVSITSPEDALDSDVVHVNLTAWSRADPDVRTSIPLRLIVIDSLDIDEETCQKRGEEEYVRPFTTNEANTPGFGVVSMLAAFALVGAVLRRRK